MSRLEDLFENYNIESYFEEQQNPELSDTYKTKALDRTLEKLEANGTGQVRRIRKHRRFRLSGIAAALVVLIFASGIVFASGKGSGIFANYFGADNNKIANSIDNMSTAIGQSKEANGYRITLSECLNDDNTVYILLDITAPRGVKLNERQYCFENQYIYVEGGGSMGYYSDQMEDDNREDNQISIMYSVEHNSGITGKNISIELGNLSYYGEDSELITQIKGDWDFSFALKKNVESRKYWQFKKLEIKERDYWITSMKISPISATLNISRSLTSVWKPGYMDTSDLLEVIKITLKDGETVEIIGGGGGTKNIGYAANFQFEKAIDLEQIESIQYKGITLRYS